LWSANAGARGGSNQSQKPLPTDEYQDFAHSL
jgi:hypothetical protein